MSVTVFKFTSEQHKNLILISLQHLKRHIITECSSTFHQKQLLASFKTIQQGKQMEICLLINTHLMANLPHFSDFHLKIVYLLSRYITLICLSYYNFESISMTFIYSSERLLFKVVLIWGITGVLMGILLHSKGLCSDGLYRRWDTGRRMASRQRGNKVFDSHHSGQARKSRDLFSVEVKSHPTQKNI